VGGLEAALLGFLLNALWQAPVLAAAAWILARLLRSAPAAYRHRMWLAALALALMSPLLSARGSSRLGQKRIADHPAVSARGVAPDALAGARADGPWLTVPLAFSTLPWGRGVAAGYGLFLLLRSVRLLTAWRRTQQLLRRAQPAPAALAAAGAECAAAFGRDVELRLSAEVSAPMTFGVRRAVVVLPAAYALTASREGLSGALAHELAHIVRRDCALNLMCELLALPLSFHPAVGFLRRRIAGARESACDEAAAALVGAGSYARTLLDVAARATRPLRLAGAMGALDGDSLEDRMQNLLGERRVMRGRRAALALGIAVGGLAALSRLVSASAITVATEAEPSDMVGHWIGSLRDSHGSDRPGADLSIALSKAGPAIRFTLYRYHLLADGSTDVKTEVLPIVQHSVEHGVLRFRTRTDQSDRPRPEDPPTEVDWEFAVVGKDAGALRMLRNAKLAADKAAGQDVPPPPLAMTRQPKAQ